MALGVGTLVVDATDNFLVNVGKNTKDSWISTWRVY
jgi:hypothetical protein